MIIMLQNNNRRRSREK